MKNKSFFILQTISSARIFKRIKIPPDNSHSLIIFTSLIQGLWRCSLHLLSWNLTKHSFSCVCVYPWYLFSVDFRTWVLSSCLGSENIKILAKYYKEYLHSWSYSAIHKKRFTQLRYIQTLLYVLRHSCEWGKKPALRKFTFQWEIQATSKCRDNNAILLQDSCPP